MINDRLVPLHGDTQNEFDADYIRDTQTISSSNTLASLRTTLTTWKNLLNDQALGYFRAGMPSQTPDPFVPNVDYLVELYREDTNHAHALFTASGSVISMSTDGSGYWQNPIKIALFSEIPTAVSQLDNDLGFITSAQIDTGVTTFNGRAGNVVPVSGDYTPAMVGINAAGILKQSGGTVSAAVAGTDYQAPMTAGTDYQLPMKVELSTATGAGTNKYSMFFKMYKNTSTTNCTATFLITGTNDFTDPNSDLYLLVCRAKSSGFSGTVTKLHGSDGADPEFGYYLSDNEWYVGVTRENYSRHTAVILLQSEGSQVNYTALKEWATSQAEPTGWTPFATVEDYSETGVAHQAYLPYNGNVTYKTFLKFAKPSGTGHLTVLVAGAGNVNAGAADGVYILTCRYTSDAITPLVKGIIRFPGDSANPPTVQFGYYQDETYWYIGVKTPKYSGYSRAILLEGSGVIQVGFKNWAIETVMPTGWVGIDTTDLITLDTTPTSASSNGITSGGVYTAFANKLGRTDNLTAANTSTAAMARAISIGTGDLVAGSSTLTAGTIYLKYDGA